VTIGCVLQRSVRYLHQESRGGGVPGLDTNELKEKPRTTGAHEIVGSVNHVFSLAVLGRGVGEV
jgi:hypothetical protein